MLTSIHRKRHQRAANKTFRQANQIIENDDLWLGRFVVKQDASWFFDPYHEGSPNLFVKYHFYDKKTGITSLPYIGRADSLFWFNDIMYKMNDFIIHEVRVWEREHPFTDERVNYRSFDQ